jgi:hypothetical protein
MRLQVGVLWTRRANGANLKVTDMDQNTTVCCTVNYRLDRREAKQFAGIISITNVRNGRTTEAYWSGATSSLHYAKQGYDLSVRQLFYQLVSKNIIPNKQKQYKSLVGLVNDARLAGVLDWRNVVDRGRNAYRPRNWANPGEMAKEMAAQFQDRQVGDQPYYLEVMVEKQALEGVLLPVCQELDITFMANKGYSSASAFYRAGKRFANEPLEGKKLIVLYLGDHDPSGIDMTRDIFERVPLLGGTP